MIESVERALEGDPAEPLADVVAALRDELRGQRAAAQFRAVIEQAKGVLVERHRITLDEAFARLRAMSQEHNVRLVEVAATIVGVAVPPLADDELALPEEALRSRIPSSPAASRTWNALQAQPDVRAGVVTALLDTVAGATDQGDEAAEVLAELLSPHGASAVTLYRTSADGSLRLVGQRGVPGDAISPWRSIPPSRDIPYVRAVQDDEAFFWPDRAARSAQFPSVKPTTRFDAAAVVPVSDGGSVVGVVGLLWDGPEPFDPDLVESITRLVARVAPMLMRSTAAADPELEWLNTLLRLHLDPWVLLETIPGADGTVRDFVVQDVAGQVPGSAEWLGRRMVEMWPSTAQDGTAHSLATLFRAGGAWSTTVAGDGSEAPWGTPGSQIRAVRLGQRVVLVWRPAG